MSINIFERREKPDLHIRKNLEHSGFGKRNSKCNNSFQYSQKRIEKNASSSETIDAAVYQIGLSLKKANEFEFLIEKRKCHLPKAFCDNPNMEENQ